MTFVVEIVVLGMMTLMVALLTQRPLQNPNDFVLMLRSK
jgi:hypothetical protein